MKWIKHHLGFFESFQEQFHQYWQSCQASVITNSENTLLSSNKVKARRSVGRSDSSVQIELGGTPGEPHVWLLHPSSSGPKQSECELICWDLHFAVGPSCLFVDDQTSFLPPRNRSHMDFHPNGAERRRDGDEGETLALRSPPHADLIEGSHFKMSCCQFVWGETWFASSPPTSPSWPVSEVKAPPAPAFVIFHLLFPQNSDFSPLCLILKHAVSSCRA